MDKLMQISEAMKNNNGILGLLSGINNKAQVGQDGQEDKTNLNCIFEALKQIIYETPLERWRRITKQKIIKRKVTPFQQLMSLITSVFSSKNESKKDRSQKRRKTKRNGKKRTSRNGRKGTFYL